MESAGVADLKARSSEYLARVKSGEEVLVTDRGRPVARLVPVGTETIADDKAEAARLTAMEKEGLLRPGSGALPEGFFEKERPEDPEGLLVEAAMEEREKAARRCGSGTPRRSYPLSSESLARRHCSGCSNRIPGWRSGGPRESSAHRPSPAAPGKVRSSLKVKHRPAGS